VKPACSVRPAYRSDAGRIAEGLEVASGGLLSMMLGGRWRTVLSRVVGIPGHEMSYEAARIAMVGEEPVGVAVSSAVDTSPVEEVMRKAAGRSLVRLAVVSAAAAPILRFMSGHGTGAWHLTALAVDVSHRGEGIGSVLVNDTLQRAIEHGAAALTLDVDTANDGARHLYERLGFVKTEPSGRAWLIGGAQVTRMNLSLA
jgi:ribosomal protein S18 acetylase RimI-like enzyme